MSGEKTEELLIKHHLSSKDYNLPTLLEQPIKSQLTVEAANTRLPKTGSRVLQQTRERVIRIHKISKYLQQI